MKSRLRVVLAFLMGLALLLLLSASFHAVQATDITVCPSGPPDCAFTSIQAAVDSAGAGDIIKIAAGIYTGVYTRGGVTQIAYISKTVTLQGGYQVPFVNPPDPVANPTILDAQQQGRVFYIIGNTGATIEGLDITGGIASSGGGIYAISATVTISNNRIYGNTAYDGGGLYLSHSTATLNANTITFNDASLGGGASLENDAATLSRNTIASNQALASGGGLYLSFSGAYLDHNTVATNMAFYGGGLYLLSSPGATFDQDAVTANTAEYGGGLYLLSSNTVLSNTVVRYNVATSGGGLYVSGGNPTLDNMVVADNHANGQGSGVYIGDSFPQLRQTTIARNTGGDGSGVYVGPGGSSVVGLTNTILVNHTVGISVTGGNVVTVNGVLWYNTPVTVSRSSTATVTVQNEHVGNPSFNTDGYHIISGSAAIDCGVDSGVATDIDGELRPYSGIYDLGADEFHPTPAMSITKQASPNPVQAGARLTYIIRITNTGNVDLHAIVTDVLPAHVTTTQPLVWTPVTITAPGGVWTQAVVVTVSWGYSGTLSNVVKAATAEGAEGSTIVTSLAQVTPALVVTKDVNPNPVQAGERLTYTIRVTNTGNVDLHALVTDTLPAQVTPSGVRTWAPTIAAPGGVWTQLVTATVMHNYAGQFTNWVDVTTAEGATGFYAITSDAQIAPTLALNVQASPDPVRAGAHLTYTIRITNTGNADLHATATDKLPAHVIASGTAPGGTLTWTPITLTSPGGVWIKTFVVTVTSGYAGPLANIVQVDTTEGTTSVYTETTLSLAPLVAVTQQTSPNIVEPGALFTYTIQVANIGNVDLHTIVMDTLPAHVTPTGVLLWTPVINAMGGVWTHQLAATVEKGYTGPLVNVVRVTSIEGATGVSTQTTTVLTPIYLPLVMNHGGFIPGPTTALYLHRQDISPQYFLSPTIQAGTFLAADLSSATEWQMGLSKSLVGNTYGYNIYAGSLYPDRGGGVVCDVEILLRRSGTDTLLAGWPQAFTTLNSYQAALFSAWGEGVNPNVRAGDMLILRITPHNGTVRIWMDTQSGNGGYSNIQIPVYAP